MVEEDGRESGGRELCRPGRTLWLRPWQAWRRRGGGGRPGGDDDVGVGFVSCVMDKWRDDAKVEGDDDDAPLLCREKVGGT